MARQDVMEALGLELNESNLKIAEWMETNGGEWIEWMVDYAQRKTNDKTFWDYVKALKLVRRSLSAAESRLHEIIEESEQKQDLWCWLDHDEPYPPKCLHRSLEELEEVSNWLISRRVEAVVSEISGEAERPNEGMAGVPFPTYIAWLKLLGRVFLREARIRINNVCEEEERRAVAMGVYAKFTDKEIEYGEMDDRWERAVLERDYRTARDCVKAMTRQPQRGN